MSDGSIEIDPQKFNELYAEIMREAKWKKRWKKEYDENMARLKREYKSRL